MFEKNQKQSEQAGKQQVQEKKPEQNQETKLEQKPVQKTKEQELIEKVAEYKNDLQRLQAEFENYKKRTEKEQMHFREFANANFAKEFLTILDSFEQAIKIDNHSKEEILKGLTALYSQFKSLLSKHGLKEIQAIGKKFDPEYHEVLLLEQNPKKADELIVEEFQKGYLFKDKVLRHSKVKINRLPELEEQSEKQKENVNEKKVEEKKVEENKIEEKK